MSSTPSNFPEPYSANYDEESGKYLLANLVGLSYKQMVRNGEGNRHAGDSKYYRLILVHALFGAFAFLILMPAALICARFLTGGPRPRLAMWGHVGFQSAALVCVTITFVTGWSAIGGKENWGKNPHHQIGAAIYAAMIFQLFLGMFTRWRMQRIIEKYVPLHLMVHRWIGRGTFLLGLAQIPLGLFVYGSPLALFILYAVVVGIFLCIWFLCEYLMNRGYFSHGFFGHNQRRSQIPTEPEMVENRSSVNHHDDEQDHLEPGLSAIQSVDNTPRKSRFSKLSWFSRRNRHPEYQTTGMPYPEDGLTSGETSRVQSELSPAGGLAPPPAHNAPPVPTIPAGYDTPGLDGYNNNVQEALRGSTTLGKGNVSQPQQAYDPYLGHHQGHVRGGSGYDVNAPYTDMPISPNEGNGGYMESGTGFVPTPVSDIAAPPLVPLPMPPHRRDRSTDSTGGPTSPTRPTGPNQSNIAVQVKLNPDKSVTVRRLQPEEAERERRERARHRQERALQQEIDLAAQQERERQAAAAAALAQQQQQQQSRARKSQEQSRKSHSREQSRSRPNTSHQPHQLRHQSSWSAKDDQSALNGGGHDSNLGSALNSPYTPSVGGQSSTIAHAAGGLLGQIPPLSPMIGAHDSPASSSLGSSNLSPIRGVPLRDETVSPEPGVSPVLSPGSRGMSPGLGSGVGGGSGIGGYGAGGPLIGMTPMTPVQRAVQTSVGSQSGTVTAENSEMEQEIVKEQRRRRRREERQQGGGVSGVGGVSSVAGRYPSTEWT